MPDREWYCVEGGNGARLSDGTRTEFPNKEAALAIARSEAPHVDGTLTVVKYTRKEVRTLQRQVTIQEADVPPTA